MSESIFIISVSLFAYFMQTSDETFEVFYLKKILENQMLTHKFNLNELELTKEKHTHPLPH